MRIVSYRPDAVIYASAIVKPPCDNGSAAIRKLHVNLVRMFFYMIITLCNVYRVHVFNFRAVKLINNHIVENTVIHSFLQISKFSQQSRRLVCRYLEKPSTAGRRFFAAVSTRLNVGPISS